MHKEFFKIKSNNLINYLKKNGTRLFFAGSLTKQTYMAGRNFHVSGELKNTDSVNNHTY